jgi:hypothetical protein
MKRFVILAVVLAIAVMIPSMALGSSSTDCSYHPQNCGTTTQGTSTTEAEGTTAAPVATESEGTLPFTGLDVALLAAGGGTLLAAGFVVRRLSSSRQN